MGARESLVPLAGDETLRLADFARACKAAARVVALYPATHPAIRTSLSRVAETASRLRGRTSAVLTIFPDSLQLDGRATVKAEPAVGELAALLHSHLIGELRLAGDLTAEEWHRFLSLVARDPEDVRAEGGIAGAWMTAASEALGLRQIDYAEVLRERAHGQECDWERIIANYLEGDLSDLDDEALAALFEIAEDLGRFALFTEQLVAKASESGRPDKLRVVLRLLQALADFAARQRPDQLNRILTHIAGIVPRLTPELVLALATRGVGDTDGDVPGIDLPGEVRSRVSDGTIAEFVAQAVSRDRGATERLAQAFQALVPDPARRPELLERAAGEAARLPIGRQPDFQELWKRVSDMLANYSDDKHVSSGYGRDLLGARIQAIEVERVSDDPPERISQWRQTVGQDSVRELEHQVLADLLAIETRGEAWHEVLESALAAIQQLVLTEHVNLAHLLLLAIVRAADDGQPFADAARAGLERLRRGTLMRHVVIVLRQTPAEEVEAMAAFCRTLGPSIIGALAEALANETGVAVKGLRTVLLSFGAAGRAYADNLRSSPNPTVRRTAIELLRAFGGAEALPDLTALLDDTEPAIQRDALRAIVRIGTDEAYEVLRRALESTNPQTRDAMMQVLIATRDERAAPLFVYILEHGDQRAHLEAVYLSAIETLGQPGADSLAITALMRVLYRGGWWVPRRTRRLRTAAATALGACGCPEGREALEEAAASGPRGVRRVARAALAATARATDAPPRRIA
jgi:hypothetical protein